MNIISIDVPKPHFIKRGLGWVTRIFWRFYWVRKFFSFGKGSVIDSPSYIYGGSSIDIGENVNVWRFGRIEAFSSDSSDKKIKLTIGDRTTIHPFVHIGAALSVEIGKGCLIASNVYISDHDHVFDLENKPPWKGGKLVVASVVIGDYVWLGEKVMVLKGVTIGANSIIGAGSVVTKNIPPNSIAVGVPAVVIRCMKTEKSASLVK